MASTPTAQLLFVQRKLSSPVVALLSGYLTGVRTRIALDYAKGRVLDLGCGDAETYRLARNAITKYDGVERHAEVVARLRETHPEASFHLCDIDEEPLPEGIEADVVLLIALIEHIFNQKHMIRQAIKCLAPAGRIVITTPTPFGNDVVHRLGSKLGVFSKDAVNDHIVVYNRKRFEILAQEVGLEIERYKRFQVGCNQLVVMRLPITD